SGANNPTKRTRARGAHQSAPRPPPGRSPGVCLGCVEAEVEAERHGSPRHTDQGHAEWAVPASMLLSGSVVLFFRGKTVWCLLQLLGAGCLVVVVLIHGLRGTSLVSLDALVVRPRRWSLSRFVERCPRFHIVSRGISVF